MWSSVVRKPGLQFRTSDTSTHTLATQSLSTHKCFADFQADKSAGKKKGQGQGAGKEGGDQAGADEDNEAVESSKYGGVGWPKTAEEGDKDV